MNSEAHRVRLSALRASVEPTTRGFSVRVPGNVKERIAR